MPAGEEIEKEADEERRRSSNGGRRFERVVRATEEKPVTVWSIWRIVRTKNRP